MSKTDSILKNSGISVLSFFSIAIFTFVVRTYFIKILGIDLLGLNALFTSILFILSFAELGISTATTFALHKPFHSGNFKLVKALLKLFGNFYRLIFFVVMVIGISIMPFLHLVTEIEITNKIYLFYFLFLAGNAINYIFCEYKTFLLVAQKNYIETGSKIFFSLLNMIGQLIVLINFESYELYLIVFACSNLLNVIFLKLFSRMNYPHVFEVSDIKVTDEEKKIIYKNITGMIYHKFGSVIVTGTDNILISIFSGITKLGIYSNYFLVFSLIKSLLSSLVRPLVGTIGLINYEAKTDDDYVKFVQIFYAYSLFALISSIGFYYLVNDFISIWIGKSYLLNQLEILTITISMFIIVIRNPIIIYIDSLGYFWDIRFKSLFEAAINLVASLIFLIYFNMGITGVLLGTIVSNLSTNIWWEPYIVYKKNFNRSLWSYFKLLIKPFIILVLLLTIDFSMDFKQIGSSGIPNLMLKGIYITLLVVLIFFISHFNSKEQNYFISLAKKVFRHEK